MEENTSPTPQSPLQPQHKEFFIIGSIFTVLMLLVASGILYFQNYSDLTSLKSVQENRDNFVYILDNEGNNTGFAKDSKHIYFAYPPQGITGIAAPDSGKIGYKQEVDYDTFEIIGLNGIYSRDKNYVYYSTDAQFSAIPGADPATFIASSTDVWAAQDKNHIYKWNQVIGTTTSQTSFPNITKNGTTTLVFQDTGEESVYTMNTSQVYYFGRLIEGADPSSFVALSIAPAAGGNTHEWAKDKNHVYDFGKTVSGADASTFVTVYLGTMKDKNKVYALASYDEQTHVYSPDGEYAADPATFVSVGYSFFKDKNHAYNSGYGVRLDKVDLPSFTGIDATHAEDKNNKYVVGTGNLGVGVVVTTTAK